MPATQAEKVHENRVRRMAERQGLRLQKSRRRDPRALDYGVYVLIDNATDLVVSGASKSLADIERYLTGDQEGPHVAQRVEGVSWMARARVILDDLGRRD